MEKVEYRVRPVTRFIVTKYEEEGAAQSVQTMGEYDNQFVAQEVAYALCKADHERRGWAPGDPRMVYPAMVPEVNVLAA